MHEARARRPPGARQSSCAQRGPGPGGAHAISARKKQRPSACWRGSCFSRAGRWTGASAARSARRRSVGCYSPARRRRTTQMGVSAGRGMVRDSGGWRVSGVCSALRMGCEAGAGCVAWAKGHPSISPRHYKGWGPGGEINVSQSGLKLEPWRLRSTLGCVF